MIKVFLGDLKKYGMKTAWFNLKFLIAYKALGATHMSVRTKKS